MLIIEYMYFSQMVVREALSKPVKQRDEVFQSVTKETHLYPQDRVDSIRDLCWKTWRESRAV
jgi:hypothetical protein